MADVVQFKVAVAAIDLGDVTLRIKGPTLAQTAELTKLVKALDFTAVLDAAKPVLTAASAKDTPFLPTLVSALPGLLPVVADAVGHAAAGALFDAAIAVLDTRHNLGRVIKASAAPDADACDLPIDLDSGDSVEAPDGTYLMHTGLRSWLRETLTADAAWRTVNAAIVLGGADLGKALVSRIAAAVRATAATPPTQVAQAPETPTVLTETTVTAAEA